MLFNARYGTNDIKAAKRFYDAIAAVMGAKQVMDRPGLIGYKGEQGETFLIGTPHNGAATAGNGTQIVLKLANRDMVDAMHAKALEMGAKDEGAPGVRGDDPGGFYGAYFRDLDGNKLCVFHWG